MMKSVLIANRGEIACRVIRTAKQLGIRTIAVYSDADVHALHVRLADEAVHIGKSPAAESYLLGERIIAAARSAGAEAIHPGYGFLSENAGFAEAVVEAGIIWVGPDASSIRAMGLKDAAKTLMQAANVPVTPGYIGDDQTASHLKAEAKTIGYPVLIKAVSGGGGKGMRKVDTAKDFEDALISCQREAKASFGDDTVLLEKWINNPRHIEVQVFGDSQGNVVHLFERDCTLQRRHQKVIEEAPAPGMDEATREAVCSAAVNAARAVNYVGAGTVEFIADGSGQLDANRIWFMEMNTRLQVEHPVTEEITGVDLVEWQLRIASGEPLPKRQDELKIKGWAMEARLYAENPSTGFLPSTGRLDALYLPEQLARIESGVVRGADVSPFYDPMIAKLICTGETRDAARLTLAKACDEVATYPVHNNAGFLSRLLRDPVFAAGAATTGFIGDNLDWLALRPEPSESGLAAATALISERERAHDAASPASIPWGELTGFRLNSCPDLDVQIAVDGENQQAKLVVHSTNASSPLILGDSVLLVESGWPFIITLPEHGSAAGGHSASAGSILSPMPGRIISVAVSEGDSVSAGQSLVTVEAMKMEHVLKAPFDGEVSDLKAATYDQVTDGKLLMTILRADAGDL
jgi:3-methylcrotonyl-CoA carboxylase alpha subunit